ncbi:hypothetical protein Riv7116_0439 [Rivularia sp. PCC 7116]|uniref:hypothetical protein n=1 Tax=Rivularia sp. PCC 7116 TaxID=373994 RepID=UPI00029EE0E1|nr:hypothetical protein [Rivularia sp. PCC 7116]AFY53042.1 hypothetical protein Riv7116_0439 [Rivularia sp. PCC 7116]
MLNRMRTITFAALMLATASPVIVNNTAVAQVQRPTKIASTVLATVNGQQLTQSMVNSAIEVGEFLAGQKFTAADKQWVRDLLIKGFRDNSVEFMQGYRLVEEVLPGIKKHSQNPLKLAYGREKLFANIYLSNLANNSLNKPSIMTVVYKYSPVIYVDPTYKIVVTKRTVDAMNASSKFVAQLAGTSVRNPTYEGWARGLQRTRSGFSSANVRKSFATAESRWVRLQQAWSNTPPQERQKAVALINKYFQRGHKIHNIAREFENIANGENRTANSSNTMSQFNSDMQKIDYFRRMMAY